MFKKVKKKGLNIFLQKKEKDECFNMLNILNYSV